MAKVLAGMTGGRVSNSPIGKWLSRRPPMIAHLWPKVFVTVTGVKK
jgi:hypothetical protein